MDDTTVPESIYESIEALDAYVSDVRARREVRQATRAKRAHCERAIELLMAETDAAEADGDDQMVAELCAVVGRFRAILAELDPAVRACVPAESLLLTPVQEPDPGPEPASSVETAPQDDVDAVVSRLIDSVAPAVGRDEAEGVTPASVPTAEEFAAAEPHLARLRELDAQWDAADKQGLGQPGDAGARGRRFGLRVMACEAARTLAAARLEGLGRAVEPSAVQLRDDIDIGRSYVGDGYPCFPFEAEAWSAARAVSPEQWRRLAEAYAVVAEASDAFDWFCQRPLPETRTLSANLLNSIGSAQQLLYRELAALGGEDHLQTVFYGKLKDAAAKVDFLKSLHPNTSDAELATLAGRLQADLDAMQAAAVDAVEKSAKVARREDAVKAVVKWSKTVDPEAVAEAGLANHRAAVAMLLDACREAGVPSSNAEVRTALLDLGPALLEGIDRHSKFLEAITAERQRQGLDAVGQADPDDADQDIPLCLDQYEPVVAAYMAGRRLVILGGVSRKHTVDELRQRLRCADVEWLQSRKSDKVGKFEAEVRKADVLVLCKNFAGHDMSEKGREWMKESGGDFILLPGGYGVRQIIYRLHQFIDRPNGHT